MDMADGKRDGKYFGREVEWPEAPPPRRLLPYDPRPAWSPMDGYYTTPHNQDSVRFRGDPRDPSELPFDWRKHSGLLAKPPVFGSEPPQYRHENWHACQRAEEEHLAYPRPVRPIPKPIPPPPSYMYEIEAVAYDWPAPRPWDTCVYH